jgi:hypothetical protein
MAVQGDESKVGTQLVVFPLATLPDVIWGPLAVGSLRLAVGLIGLAAGQPRFFPYLGPTAFLQAEEPG